MTDPWRRAPGGTARPRSAHALLRKALIGVLTGMMTLGVAWAGAGLVPISVEAPAPAGPATGKGSLPSSEDGRRKLAQLDASQTGLLAGAAAVSLRPRPDDYGGTWETDYNKCANLSGNPDSVKEGLMHVADFRVRWAENSNCIYMGGYGIGPMNPIVSWDDEYGLAARAVAVSDGKQTVVLTLIDAIYWEGRYDSLCDGCGFLDLAESLATETGLTPESFIFASSHSHTSPDFIGGWGGVPEWYMTQATDALRTAATTAIANMEPAVLETGEVLARPFNGERRDFYRSAEDDTMSWFRLIDADDQPRPETCVTPTPEPAPSPTKVKPKDPPPSPAPTPTPICEPASPGKAIATVGAFPAHPVTADESTGRADADFPAVFAKRVEERFGGVGMFLQTGLGNVSPRGDKLTMGNGLASLMPAIGAGTPVTGATVKVGRVAWNQPVTNGPLGALAAGGFFDRSFEETPAVVSEGKGPENKKCRSASPVSVRTTVSAAKIGSLWITGGPGELFSNLTNTIEEQNPGGVTLALGLVNDGLGYIVQSFESDFIGRQGTGFVGKAGPVGIAEYEDAYSMDHCIGDAVLEKTIGLLGSL